ncbi:hypothetical protein ACHAXT_009669 [Thalassiosira profunda]
MAPSTRRRALALLAASTAASSAAAFSAPAATSLQCTSRARLVRRPRSSTLRLSGSDDDAGDFAEGNFYNDFDDAAGQFSSFSSASNNPPSRSISAATDPSFFESLRFRRQQLQQSSRELLEQWKTGSAKTFAAFTINEGFYKQQEENALGGTDASSSSKSFPGAPYSLSSSSGDMEELPFDWVRRVSIGSYPRVACGSACGSVFVADVESKRVLGAARNVHSSSHTPESVDALDEKLRSWIYGDYDGGGVLAVAMSRGNNLVASAGREGGVKLFKLAGEGELKFVGDVPSLKRPLPGTTPTLITCLQFDAAGRLFMGGADGLLRMVSFAQDDSASGNAFYTEMQIATISSLDQQANEQPSPILSIDVSDELDMVAAAHANGNVCVYATNREVHGGRSDRFLGVWNPYADTNSASHARSVAFVLGGEKEGEEATYSLVTGGGNGSLWMQEIHPCHVPTSSLRMENDADEMANDVPSSLTTRPLFKENSMQPIKPSHQGPVLSLASRPGGILVSAGHDGMLRVSQLFPAPQALYGLGGYKVWIGNICIDPEGKRLLSDGRDDVVVVHDFSRDDEQDIYDGEV